MSPSPSSAPWYVYILRCRDGSLYTGITNDLDRRCRQHNEGTASRCTRSRRPTRLVYHERHPSRSQALKREAAIKAWPRRRKLWLVRCNTSDEGQAPPTLPAREKPHSLRQK